MKTIKLIDLLNMLANEEFDKIPEKIRIAGKEYQLEISKKDGDCRYNTKLVELSEYAYAELLMNVSRFQLNQNVEIIEEPILDEKEKEYLRKVIKPFRNEVGSIVKWSVKPDCSIETLEYIAISFIDYDKYVGNIMEFPCFPKGEMYKGMESDKKYTLEELGL